MRPALGIIALVVFAILLSALLTHKTPVPVVDSSATQNSAAASALTPGPDRAKAYDKMKEGAIHATLVIEKRGVIGLELYPKAAPETVAHFVALCKRHFYDGILFHRVEPGYVVQAGDPASKKVKGADIANITSNQASEKYGLGMGGSDASGGSNGTTVPLEARLPHLANTIGLAHPQDPGGGDSQFFINLKDNQNLDGGFCAFGRVVSGADIVPKIRQGDRIARLTVP